MQHRFKGLIYLVASIFLLLGCGGGSNGNNNEGDANGGGALTPSASLNLTTASQFTSFESGHVRPLALSADGSRLFAVNTPANTLDIFAVSNTGLSYLSSIPVGLEPVAVAVKSSSEVWVVNHLSDSVSIIDLSSPVAQVKQTLLVGDEPRDIVFAGTLKQRAFITSAHRGQNSPYSPSLMPNDPAQTTVSGIGRADVWVFDSNATGSSLAGDVETIITVFTDTPRALAVSNDGSQVYVAGFLSGNQTTSITEGGVCDGGASAISCVLNDSSTAPGGLPAPNTNTGGTAQNETALIVRLNQSNGKWEDELQRDWSAQVKFNLPDKDVFVINAEANPPVETASFSSVGTVLFNMAVNPQSGKVYVSNTEAQNQVRFEGTRNSTTFSTVNGHSHESRITVLDGVNVNPRHLNKHIDYSQIPAAVGVKNNSLATPTAMVVSADGSKLYVAAFGSAKVGVFDTAKLENDSFVPDSTNHIFISGGGPSGLVLDETRQRLYVMSRFDNGISVLDTSNNTELSHLTLLNPEPAVVTNGRAFLYDANITSSNGEASCSSCHVFGDFDSLAWDLGDPESSVLTNPNPSVPLPFIQAGDRPFHPLKGPMTTQSLRGLRGQGPMHWRGDRVDRSKTYTTSNIPNSLGSFKEFNVAFPGLLGRGSELAQNDMNAFADFMLQVSYPPNPNRPLDDSLTLRQQAGSDTFFNRNTTGVFGNFALFKCNQCHLIDPDNGFFGSNGLMSFESEPQDFKIPHLRNMYQKVGMFGMSPIVNGIFTGNADHKGDQIRGFGFIHDGSIDTIARFHSSAVFLFAVDANAQKARRDEVEQFMHAMDSNIKPIIGQQVTLTSSNLAAVNTRLQLLFSRMDAGDNEVIAKGVFADSAFGAVRLSDGKFQLDDINQQPISEAELLQRATVVIQAITFTAVPLQSSRRLGVDADDDLILDANDNCPIKANADQIDQDNDGVGDACE